MSGLLIPDDYHYIKPNQNDMNIASIAWGVSLVFLWAIQIQALIQIIINRIAILMVVRSNAKKLKIAAFFIMLVINVSVFCIWIPARLQINDDWVKINNVWDRIEKVIFLLVDAGLNLYFIHLVRSRLIANGLTKYGRLFRFNLGMIAVSMTMDVLLIAMMSLPNDIIRPIPPPRIPRQAPHRDEHGRPHHKGRQGQQPLRLPRLLRLALSHDPAQELAGPDGQH
ncbi:hypothetical protein ACJ41O_003874 [Fusarium nematophilum]